MPVQSKKYDFTNLISENHLCQSWQASDSETGEVFYVKTPTPNGSLDLQTANQILSDSFVHQRLIKTTRILTADARHNEDGVLFIEYPFLDTDAWQGLDAETMSESPTEVLLQVGLIVDYLHLLGLVHGDLKLSNFLSAAGDSEPSIMLIDLDFLTEAHQHPQAKVFGTPEHIAPEVEANQIIVPQSDNYSLGVSFQQALEACPAFTKPTSESKRAVACKLGSLVTRLKADEWSERPRFLTTALFEEKIIDEATFEASQKTLLAMKLLGDFRLSPRKASSKVNLARDLLSARNRVMGLGDELLDDMTRAFTADRMTTFRASRRFLDSVRIERFGDYWHVIPSDQQLRDSFKELEGIWLAASGDTAGAKRADRCKPEVLIAEAIAQKEAGNLQKSLFGLEDCVATLDAASAPADDPNRLQALQELVEVSSGLNRLNDASRYCDKLLEGLPEDSDEHLSWFYESTLLSIGTGDTARMKTQIEEGAKLAERLGNREHQLKYGRLTAWQLSVEGKHDEADQMLAPLYDAAIDEGFHGIAVLIQYTRGVLEWRRGDYLQSEKRLLEALKLAKAKDVTAEANPVLVMLSQLLSELADYGRSVKYGKMAIRRALTPKDFARLPSVFPQLMFGFVRLGEYKKAEYWLQRYLNLKFVFDNNSRMVLYYLHNGFLRGNMGDLFAAKESWRRALEMSPSVQSQRHMGKIHQNLAEVAFFQGEVERCEHHAQKASTYFETAGDKATQSEVALFGSLCDAYYSKECSSTRLISSLRSLIENDCRFYAAICLFHLNSAGDSATIREAIEITEPLMEQFENSRSPLLNAAATLVRFAKKTTDDKNELLRVLRTIYRAVDKAGQRFLSLVVCQRLAGIYEASANHKLAQKFYTNSLKIAEALGNEVFAKKIREHLDSLTYDSGNRERLVDSIHGISEAISAIDNYDDSLHMMVKFAVEQTGAERGALLLKRGEKAELQVVAYLHCDEDSLVDIQEISTRVPKAAIAEARPIIIENALTDKRTKQYQSIVYHNILSVACLPIVRGQEQVGALYLDHHTIPALFDRSDIKYMTAIANFLSVFLAVAQRYRASRTVHDQLMNDLNRLGEKQSFITNDPSVKQLLSRLPEIAGSNSAVLITGESGTGKEILAQLIHNLSSRAKEPMIKMNCSAIPKDLIEAELFGVAKDTATGVGPREGKFAAADNGTLLLDEIGDMAYGVQAKLLRVLEYQQFEKVGSNRTISVDIRFLYSTNKDLRKAVKSAEFREDLLYRINTFTIEIPPLRERPNDIPLLVEHFIGVFSEGKPAPLLSSEAMEHLNAYQWPGNVRELKNLVERLCILYPGQRVEKPMLPKDLGTGESDSVSAKQMAEAREKAAIVKALIKANWNQSKASRDLGMALSTLRRRIEKYGIKKP